MTHIRRATPLNWSLRGASKGYVIFMTYHMTQVRMHWKAALAARLDPTGTALIGTHLFLSDQLTPEGGAY